MGGFNRLLARIKKYRKYFVLSIGSNIMLSIFTVFSIPLLIPFFQMLFESTPPVTSPPESGDINLWINYYLSDIVVQFGREHALIVVCLVMIGVFFLKNVFRYLALYFMAPLRNGIIYDIRKELFDKYLELPLSFYSNEKKGTLLSSMTTDVQEIEWSILNVIEVIFKSPIIMAGSIIFMLYVSPQLTLFVFVLMIFTVVVIGSISKTLKAESSKVQTKVGELTSTLEETLGGIRIIKGFRAESYQSNKFDNENVSFRNILTRLLWRRDLSGPISEFLGISVVTVLLWYGSLLVFEETLAPETFFAFVFAFYQVIEPAKSFASAYYNIQKGLAALERVDRVLFTSNSVLESSNPIKKLSFEDKISFENLSFKYNDEGENILSNINLDIKKGQIVALVGASGAGKSTLVDMLPRFYDPISGRVTIDGLDIRDVLFSDLRGLFGLVSQEAILFHDSIRNNITFGQEADDQAILNAAQVANAHDFISVLPQGFDTVIGDRGMKLSGGQRQRLTIARAVLRNPPILILDEATSALDSESEKLVQDALSKLMKGRTSIVIAHRLSTIQNADLIVVLDKGEIVEQGTHQVLLENGTYYKKLVNMQSMGSIS